jgi:hypothetical protein
VVSAAAPLLPPLLSNNGEVHGAGGESTTAMSGPNRVVAGGGARA